MKTLSDVMMCAGCALPFINSTKQMAATYLCVDGYKLKQTLKSVVDMMMKYSSWPNQNQHFSIP